jgi:type I restriction enzyme M protein
MRRLRRAPGKFGPARAAVVAPNGTLFGDGVCARIKEELLKEFNLHTIVRLPNGVFAPYTSIPTNLLFFDRSGPTNDVWYYEQQLPEGRKNYTKTQPIQFEEFADCIAWWQPQENPWRKFLLRHSEKRLQLDQEPQWKVDFTCPSNLRRHQQRAAHCRYHG